MSQEQDLMDDANARAAVYLASVKTRRVFPDAAQIKALDVFDEALPNAPTSEKDMLALLDDVGSPATSASTGAHYLGFVIGGLLPCRRSRRPYGQRVGPVCKFAYELTRCRKT